MYFYNDRRNIIHFSAFIDFISLTTHRVWIYGFAVIYFCYFSPQGTTYDKPFIVRLTLNIFNKPSRVPIFNVYRTIYGVSFT